MPLLRPAALALALCAATSVTSAAQPAPAPEPDPGRREYLNSCAVCHGQDGRANMQVLDVLKQAPSNLRLLAKRNGGVFPVARVYEVIDGRGQVTISAHGTRDMPVWGERYAREATSPRVLDDYPCSPELATRVRILALIDYLSRMQD